MTRDRQCRDLTAVPLPPPSWPGFASFPTSPFLVLPPSMTGLQPPNQPLFRQQDLINLFQQGKLSRCTLLAGFNTKRPPNRPISACFYRTLDFLLQHLAAGNSYRPITDKEEAKVGAGGGCGGREGAGGESRPLGPRHPAAPGMT